MLGYSVTLDPGERIEFKGFGPLTIDSLQPEHQVVVVETDNDHETWKIEGKEGLEELKRFYSVVFTGMEVRFLILDQVP